MSLTQPNILAAIDLTSGDHLYIKLLRMPETTKSHSPSQKHDAINAEIKACGVVFEANIPGLVRCEKVEVNVIHNEGLDVSPGVWTALKMKRYVSALTDLPKLSEKWLHLGFSRILEALQAMHKLNLVHMDVKSDNLFVDVDSTWNLGDFGSTREIGATLWSYTEVLNPYVIPSNATVIPAMDLVLLCVTIAIEMKKDKWKDLCGQQKRVQGPLVLDMLNTIENATFKNEVVALFERNFNIVLEHLN